MVLDDRSASLRHQSRPDQASAATGGFWPIALSVTIRNTVPLAFNKVRCMGAGQFCSLVPMKPLGLVRSVDNFIASLRKNAAGYSVRMALLRRVRFSGAWFAN